MNTQSSTIVQRLWNYCNVLRDDGMSYGDYVEQLYLSPVSQNGSGRKCHARQAECHSRTIQLGEPSAS